MGTNHMLTLSSLLGGGFVANEGGDILLMQQRRMGNK